MKKQGLPRLMLITDSNQCDEPLSERVAKACSAGIGLVQLREKHLSAKELFDLANQLRAINHTYGSTLIINDRVDIALMTEADGVHLPESGISIQIAKHWLNGKYVGKSVHSIQAGIEASTQGADYILFGPIFDTPSKRPFGAPQGIEKLEELCQHVSCPVFAVGGVTPENAKKCLNAGAYGLAAIGALMSAEDLPKTVRDFYKNL